jgi:hypothetical protein
MSSAADSSWNPFLLLGALMALNGAVLHAIDGHKHRLPPLRQLESVLSEYSVNSVGDSSSISHVNCKRLD